MNFGRHLSFIFFLFFCQEAVAWDVCLEWDPVSDQHLLFYRVYRSGSTGTEPIKAGFAEQPEGTENASYCDVGLSPYSRKYQYEVTAVNGALLESETSNQVEATLPVTLVFPQFINGQIGGSRNTSRIILRNNSDSAENGLIEFFDDSGAPTAVSIGGLTDSVFEYSIPAWGTMDLLTDGNEELISGAIEVVSDLGIASQLEGTLVYQLMDNGASVPNSPPGNSSQIYVSVIPEDEYTGIAIYNGNAESVILDLTLLDAAGMVMAEQQIVLAGRNRLAGLVGGEEFFEGLLDQFESFRGTLNITVQEGQKVSVLGLLQDPRSGALVVVPTSPMAFVP